MEKKDIRHEVEKAERFKQRFGFLMCAVYALVYAGFVAVSVWNVELMETLLPYGINLAVAYGMGLIIFALFLAFIYSTICNIVERKMMSLTTPSESEHGKGKLTHHEGGE